jgi:hemolysin activation/secretion protein
MTVFSAALSLVAHAAPDAGSLLQQLEARPGGQFSAPPLKLPQTPTPPASGEGGATLQVNAWRIEGATLLPEVQLQSAIAGFAGRELSLTQLQEAAWVIVQTYRAAGWLVHAFVPPQEIDQGVVRVHVVEARLGEVRIEYPASGNAPRDLIRNMVDAQLERGQPLSLRQVDRLLLLLDDLSGVVATASYVEGSEPGRTDLLLALGSDKPLDGSVSLDNFGARSTGANRVSANLTLQNPAGLGDTLQLQAVGSDGSRYGRVAYSLPVGVQGWRAGVHASNMNYHLVGTFAVLQASGSAQSWGADLSAPLIRQPEHNLSAQLTVDRKRFDNLALANNAATEATTVSKYQLDVVRLGLSGNWFDHVKAAQNNASVQVTRGQVDLNNSPNAQADSQAANTAGYFYKLNANYNREQSLDSQTSWYAQAAAQWANRNLDTSEKLYLGGAYGVRAYPSNEAGGSVGTTLTTGLKYRLDMAYTLNAFVDWGRINQYRNNWGSTGNELSNTNAQHLQGVGLSMTWRDTQGHEISATWSRRQGVNPATNTTTGADSDGTRILNRLWLSAALNF